LRKRGLRPGDHTACYLTNRLEHVEALLALFKIRAVPINVNYRYTAAEVGDLLRDADAAAVLHDGEFAGVVAAAREQAPIVRFSIDADAGYEEAVAAASPARDFGPRSPDDHYILYTGGTTGRPKGVVWRQEDIFFAVCGGGNPGGEPIARPERIAETVRVNRAQRLAPLLPPGDPGPEQFVQLALGPLVHASGQWSALGTLLGGGTVVLHDSRHLDMGDVLALVERERVVALNLVGDASARPLLAYLEREPARHDTSSLRLLGSGGTILSAAVKQRLLDALPSVVAITEAIGSSESPAQAVSVATRRDGPMPSLTFAPKPDTIVVDDDLRPLPPGRGLVGRLATRGRVPLGYHRDAERTARTFVTIDGVRYALPGDMATVAADGTIHLLGRGALCINTGGEKVYPEEVEAALLSHPSVADAVVVGAPDDRWGEHVAAVVRAADAADPPSLADLQAHCRGHLAGYKLPRSLHLVAAIERSTAGKADYAWARRIAAGATA
jgi:acyl-CoA synthetase (AMP-forming)/AMP-acid ligase II